MTFGLDRLDLPEQERLARRDLVRLRVAVLGRPALDHVGDVDVVARVARSPRSSSSAAGRRARRTGCPGCPRRGPAPRRRTSGRRAGCRRRTRSAGGRAVQLAARAVADVRADRPRDALRGARGRLRTVSAARPVAAASATGAPASAGPLAPRAGRAAQAGHAQFGRGTSGVRPVAARGSTDSIARCLRRAAAARRGRGSPRATLGLRLQRQLLLAVRGHERHRVGVDVEAGVGARHVVGDDQVHLLPPALLARPRDHVAGLGREADQQRAAQPPARPARVPARRGCRASARARASARPGPWRSSPARASGV